jgi:hypothetical protein
MLRNRLGACAVASLLLCMTLTGCGDDGNADSGPQSATGATSAESTSPETTAVSNVPIDNEYVTVTVGEKTVDAEDDSVCYAIDLVNNSGQAIMIEADESSFTIDGTAVSAFMSWGWTAKSDKEGSTTLCFWNADDTPLEGGVDALVNVKGQVKVLDQTAGLSVLGTYDFVQ